MARIGQAQTLSEAQQCVLFSSIAQQSAYPIRDRAIFCLSFYAGMRVGEIASLYVDDVAVFSQCSLTYRVREVATLTETKGNVPREVFLMHPTLHMAIDTHLTEANLYLNEPLFLTRSRKPFSSVTMNQLFRRTYDRAGFSKARSHSGRRTFLTTLAEQGYSLRHLQVLAGHASVQTTARYVDANPEMLRKIADAAVPKSVSRVLK